MNWPGWLQRARAAVAQALRERDRIRFGIPDADLARRQFRLSEAAERYSQYLAKRPGDAAISVRLAQTLNAAGRFDDAQTILITGLRHRPASGALKRALEAQLDPGAIAQSTDLSPTDLPLAPIGQGKRDTILLQAGQVEPSPQALAWLEHALSATGAVAAYADHRMGPPPQGGTGRAILYGAAHIEDIATTPWPPVMALFDRQAVTGGSPDLHQTLLNAFALGPVVHVPLVLARVPWIQPSSPDQTARAAGGTLEDRILVIVPTRDEAGVLRAMIDSLTATAERCDLLDIVVVDNGSRDPAALSLLDEWVATGLADVMKIDEPFNWADLNNRAAKGRQQGIFLFINNDMVMQTVGWDQRLRRHLGRRGIGAVGARLLYPAGNLQHAGMALGVTGAGQAAGEALHEGLGAWPDDPGPLGRWARTRPAAAVTGAFLATRREVFEATGGFDGDNFPVSCNDIDFCLRVRELGLTVLYAADIELTHDESRTRGHDDSDLRQARAQAEKAALSHIWGEDAVRDPSRNPHWVAHGTIVFHGLRQPEPARVLAEIARGEDAWRTQRKVPLQSTPRSL